MEFTLQLKCLSQKVSMFLFAVRENISHVLQLLFAAWSTSEVSCIYCAEMILTSASAVNFTIGQITVEKWCAAWIAN